MAQLALTVAGGAIGGFFGGPMGARVGMLAGAYIGGMVDPPPAVEGPRIDDLSVSSSAYGSPVPVVYGTMRIGTNMIWSTGLNEDKNTSRSGGKGGMSGPKQVSYTYKASFALGICEGPIDDVIRIWADSKLIYDKSGQEPSDTGKYKIRIYRGTETQTPDRLIIDDKGDYAPAYRGLAYIVFDELQLAEFGNRIPQIQVEVSGKAVDDRSIGFSASDPSGSIGVAALPLGTTVDRVRGRILSVDPGGVLVTDLDTLNTIAYVSENIPNDLQTGQFNDVNTNGQLYVTGGFGNSRPIHVYDPYTGNAIATFGTSNSSFNNSLTNIPLPEGFAANYAIGLTGIRDFVMVTAWQGAMRIFDGDLNYVWGATNFPVTDGERTTVSSSIGRNTVCPAGRDLEGNCFFYTVNRVNDSGDFNFIKHKVNFGAEYSPLSFSTPLVTRTRFTVAMTDLRVDPAETPTIEGMAFLEQDNTLILLTKEAVASGTDVVTKIDENGDIVWQTEVIANRIENTLPQFDLSRDTLGLARSGIETNIIDLVSGDIIDTIPFVGSGSTTTWPDFFFGLGRVAIWDSKRGALDYRASGETVRRFWNRAGADQIALSDVVSDICVRANLGLGDIDVSDLSSITLRGYAINRPSASRAALEQLASAYFFDAVESDGKIKFVARGGSSVKTIDEQWLKTPPQAQSVYDIMPLERAPEQNLPVRIDVGYIDQDADYQTGVQGSRRTVAPHPTMASYMKNSVQLPIAMTAQEAKDISQKALYNVWIERDTYTTMLPWRFLAVDPADPVTVDFDNGDQYELRVTAMNVGADFSIETGFVAEQPSLYSANAVAASLNVPAQSLARSVPTKGFYFDLPLLRDTDDVGRAASVWYFGAGAYLSGWTAAALYVSQDSVTYDNFRDVFNEITWGVCASILGSTDLPFQTDETNTVDVVLSANASALESVTQLAMLNGANAALIGKEIIQFRDVEIVGQNTYRLSGLLRGRRGTEWAVPTHVAGEEFILLEEAALDKNTFALDQLDASRYFKAVSVGGFFEDVEPTTKTFTGADLKPYAPWNVERLEDTPSAGDIRWTWVRRSRINGGLVDGTGGVPLAEDSEEYELYVVASLVDTADPLGFDPSVPANYLRAFTGLSSAQADYTAAQQTSDSFNAAADHSIVIYQVSAQIGRGFPRIIQYPA